MLSAWAVPHAPLHSRSPALPPCMGWHLRRCSPPGNTGMGGPGPCPSPGRESSARGQPPAAGPVPTVGSGGGWMRPQAPQREPGSAPVWQQRRSAEVKAAGCSALGVQPERCRGSKRTFSPGCPKGHRPFLRTVAKDPQLGGGTVRPPRQSRGRTRLVPPCPDAGSGILLCPEHPPKKQAAGTCPPPLSSCPPR